jgi:hypothetical protein
VPQANENNNANELAVSSTAPPSIKNSDLPQTRSLEPLRAQRASEIGFARGGRCNKHTAVAG